MGNIGSTASRYIVRKTRRFNVENRAQRYIDQEKLPAAPKHPSTSEQLEALTKDPEVREELTRKNIQLDDNLKQVYVKSFHKPVTIEDEKERLRKGNLPQERRNLGIDFKFGHEEPLVVPAGKYSLSQVIDLMALHMNDPMVNTPQVLADKYSVDVKIVESILYYFRFFKLEKVKEEKTQKLLAREVLAKFSEGAKKKLKDYKEIAISDDLRDYLKRESEGVNLRSKEMEEYARSSKEQKGKVDKELEEYEKSRSEHEKKVEGDMKQTISDNKNDESVLKENEDEVDDKKEDSVYKNVGNRKKKKKTTGA